MKSRGLGDVYKRQTFIPVVEKKKKNKKKKNDENEAVYVTPTDDSKNNKKKKTRKKKIWPFILLFFIVIAGAFYFVKSSDSNMVQVPSVLNLSEDEAVKILEEKKLKANVSRYADSNNYEKGKVMEQDPSPKKRVKTVSYTHLRAHETS